MREEYTEKPRRGLTLILVLVVLVGLLIIWFIPQVKTDSQTDEESVTIVRDEEEKFVVTEAQWNAVNKEIKQLRNEVAQLRNELAKKTNAAPAKTSPQTTTKPAATATTQPVATTATPQTTTVSAKDVTLANYSHEFLGSTARLSLKNNTDKIITSITGRIIYYDMSGNMLDYQDFTKSTTIDPGMVKSIDLKGFRTYDSYVYYKSNNANLGNKYKVKFKLQSYRSR
jgi:hypothetical protein